jgi:dienelactone hydrolase
MKKLIFLIFIIIYTIFPQPENPGSFQPGWSNIVLNRAGRNFNAIVYYPAITSGSGTQIDTSNGPYSIIAFGHGFAMQNSYYLSLFRHLASHGHIVIAPQFPDNNHLQLSYDLLFCASYIKSQSRNPNSIFYRLVDTMKVGLSGHSMGGGASLLAAANDSTIDVVAPLAAAETTPSAIAVMNKIKAAVYLITAQNDGITPPSNHQIPMYNNAIPIKGLPIFKGANHTKFMDTRIFDWTDPRGYITPSEQLRLTRRYLTSVFNLFLKEDSSYFKYTFGISAQNDTSLVLDYQLKPLRPKFFSLISPINSFITYSLNINFSWNSTYSLNLIDTIRYKILISRDSSFNYVLINQGGLLSTNYQHQFISDGQFYWKIIAYTSDSTFTESNVFTFTILLADNEDQGFKLKEFTLEQNYPNPFNPFTNIEFSIVENDLVCLSIYNVLGELVGILLNEHLASGNYKINFDGSNLTSGVYIYKLQAGKFNYSRKMLLIK